MCALQGLGAHRPSGGVLATARFHRPWCPSSACALPLARISVAAKSPAVVVVGCLVGAFWLLWQFVPPGAVALVALLRPSLGRAITHAPYGALASLGRAVYGGGGAPPAWSRCSLAQGALPAPSFSFGLRTDLRPACFAFLYRYAGGSIARPILTSCGGLRPPAPPSFLALRAHHKKAKNRPK